MTAQSKAAKRSVTRCYCTRLNRAALRDGASFHLALQGIAAKQDSAFYSAVRHDYTPPFAAVKFDTTRCYAAARSKLLFPKRGD